MKLLAEFNDESVGLEGDREQLRSEYQLRKSARAILRNSEGHIATQYLETYSFHKLPGGGVEAGESLEDAARREVLEEVGCDAEIVRPIGVVIEYQNVSRRLHISTCYLANVVGEIGKTALEDIEKEEGQVTLWLPVEEVLRRMETDTPKKYEGHFILHRERAFLKEYLASL